MRRLDSQARLVPKGQQTVVIKVGTSSLLRDEKHSLNLSSLAGICETVRDLRDQGMNVIIVSSGAVGVGCQRLGLDVRPSGLAQKQALAAVGQQHLMRYYDDFFSVLGLNSAQVLLTLDNLANRSQYINARNTFEELLRYGAIPVVNENDTVAVEQLRFGDNDTLSAQVATLVQADWLFLLTDVDSMYTANPHIDPTATPIYEVQDLTKLQVDTSSNGTQWGTGGMATKLTAARIATAAGCKMAICNSKDPSNILRIIAGQRVGTVFHPISTPIRGRKRWLLSVPVKGQLWLDEGAVRAVKDRHTSLFSAGIVKVVGDFHAQDSVRLCDAHGREFGRGLINYQHDEVDKVKGMSSQQFQDSLGYMGQEEVIHRANICLMVKGHENEGGDHEVPEPLEDPLDRGTTPPLHPAYSGAHLASVPEGGLTNGSSAAPGVQHASCAADDVVARLAVLRHRGHAVGARETNYTAPSAMPAEPGDATPPVRVMMAGAGNDDWAAELARAMSAERQRGGATSVPADQDAECSNGGADLDISDEGWLP